MQQHSCCYSPPLQQQLLACYHAQAAQAVGQPVPPMPAPPPAAARMSGIRCGRASPPPASPATSAPVRARPRLRTQFKHCLWRTVWASVAASNRLCQPPPLCLSNLRFNRKPQRHSRRCVAPGASAQALPSLSAKRSAPVPAQRHLCTSCAKHEVLVQQRPRHRLCQLATPHTGTQGLVPG